MLITLLISILLSIAILPVWAQPARPLWIALILIYYGLTIPGYKGFGLAWFLGVLLDVLYGSLLGMHAAALLVVAFIVYKWHRQLRSQPVWQQAIWVLGLLLIYECILIFVNTIIGKQMTMALFFIPAVVSSLLWPVIAMLLSRWNRHVNHTSVVLNQK